MWIDCVNSENTDQTFQGDFLKVAQSGNKQFLHAASSVHCFRRPTQVFPSQEEESVVQLITWIDCVNFGKVDWTFEGVFQKVTQSENELSVHAHFTVQC